MSKERKVCFVLNEQLWKRIKTLQINSNIKSMNDFCVAVSLQLVNNEIKISDSYDITTELQNFLNQSKTEVTP